MQQQQQQQPQEPLTNPDGHCVGPQSAEAGKAESCKGCPNASICASAPKGPDEDIEFMKHRLSAVKHRVLVLSGKGGVGKSTMTKELGFALGRRGLLTGLIDTDLCGPSLPRLTGVRDEIIHNSADGWEPISVDENVTLVSMHFLMDDKNEAVIYRGPRKNGMIKNFIKEVSWGELDVLLVDTPPGTSDEHISLVSFLSQCGGVTGAIIVTTPQEVAVADVRREIDFCRKTKVPILGFVENMSGFVCPKCKTKSIVFPSSRGDGAAKRLSEEFGPPVLGAVPLDRALMLACEEGRPLLDIDASSPAAKAIEDIAERLVEILKSHPHLGKRGTLA